MWSEGINRAVERQAGKGRAKKNRQTKRTKRDKVVCKEEPLSTLIWLSPALDGYSVSCLLASSYFKFSYLPLYIIDCAAPCICMLQELSARYLGRPARACV